MPVHSAAISSILLVSSFDLGQDCSEVNSPGSDCGKITRIVKKLPTLRVARPTDNLAAIKRMYLEGLELTLLGEFGDHESFDGVMLGQPDGPYHLEFTSKAGHTVGSAPSEDNLLVFYVADRTEWERRCAKMLEAGFVEVKSFNPYWDEHGKSFEDVDRYRVVIQRAAWPV